MISFIVPAHNEETCLGRTLPAIHESARATGQPYEIIVVDDASTDRTAEIARQLGARVILVQHRQIAATRNSGGRAAQGDRLFFIDADTVINPRAVEEALRAMDHGAVGGGGPVGFDRNEKVPLYIWLISKIGVIAPKLVGFSGGAFMFCTQDVFRAIGGFNERLFWSEELFFCLALRREGRFTGIWHPVLTSGRRFRKVSAGQLFLGALRILISPVKMFTQRVAVEKIWYDSNRADDDVAPTSLAARVGNGLACLALVVIFTEPLWIEFPWRRLHVIALSRTVYVVNAAVCHIGLLFWIPAALLFVNLMRQKRFTSVFQSALLIAFFTWNAWGSTLAVQQFWRTFYKWVA